MMIKLVKIKSSNFRRTVVFFACTLILAVLGAVSVFAQDIYGSGPHTVGSGVTAVVTGNVSGNITVNGGTLILNAGHTITGSVIVQNNGTFNMSAGTVTNTTADSIQILAGTFNLSGGTITGYGSRGVDMHQNHVNEFNMSGGTITGNSVTGAGAGGNGGGVRARADSTFTMTGGTISNNSAFGRGGGVSMQGGLFIMHNGTIEGNKTTNDPAYEGGGGVSIETGAMVGEFRMFGGRIINNEARGGGGIHVFSGVLYINASNPRFPPIISGNTATLGSGGGLRIDDGSRRTQSPRITIIGARIENNRAQTSGGGLLVGRTSPNHYVLIENTFIQNNTSGGGGGGINVTRFGGLPESTAQGNTRGHVVIYNSAITGNTAGRNIQGNATIADGGGIHVTRSSADITEQHARAGGRVYIYNSFVTNNTATRHGGGIWTIWYDNLFIHNNVVFSRNRASAAFDHGEQNRLSTTPVAAANSAGGQGGNINNINWATVTIPGTHALSNFDINYYRPGDEIDVPPRPSELTILKDLEIPQGTNIPQANFEFEVEFVHVWPEGVNTTGLSPIPNPTIPFPNRDVGSPAVSTPWPVTTLPNGNIRVSGYYTLDFDTLNMNWPAPGFYTFRVTEIANGSRPFGSPGIMIYDDSAYYIFVQVGWLHGPGSTLVVLYYRTQSCIIDWIGSGEDGEPVHLNPPTIPEAKNIDLRFTNYFMHYGDFDVEKMVLGNMGGRLTDFDFRVVFTLPHILNYLPTPPGLWDIEYSISRQANRDPVASTGGTLPIVRTPVVVNGVTVHYIFTVEHTFYLRDEEEITFYRLPFGTTYVVTEYYIAYYGQWGLATTGNMPGSPVYPPGGRGRNLYVPGRIEQSPDTQFHHNYVVVFNDRDHLPPMGALATNAPALVLLCLSVAGGLVALRMSRKKEDVVE